MFSENVQNAIFFKTFQKLIFGYPNVKGTFHFYYFTNITFGTVMKQVLTF